ncbi:CLUMA_CG014691, isoform A [Clunio marinus]|uniref:CLUMA_CG014691, isoform A n=1 Tax=Clunio marinus TaxID=568069 RepID=A0A1J1ILP3_9DIPT|nr:CLUMA_CG014691, isoform A [Clunio marinus]
MKSLDVELSLHHLKQADAHRRHQGRHTKMDLNSSKINAIRLNFHKINCVHFRKPTGSNLPFHPPQKLILG